MIDCPVIIIERILKTTIDQIAEVSFIISSFFITSLFFLNLRLHALLETEERELMREMEERRETVLERQAKMRERAKSLRERRESDRQRVVEEKLEQLFRLVVAYCGCGPSLPQLKFK